MKAKSFSEFLWVLSGPVIWTVHFFSIYITESLICTRPDPSVGVMWVAALLLTIAALALLGAVIVLQRRTFTKPGKNTEGEDRDFLPWLTLLLSMVSALAVIWVTVPVFMLPVCAFAPG
jgi:formate hydrogenlyase subunit 3/multisubunit Na+/H+ antiporter MnhD subunit